MSRRPDPHVRERRLALLEILRRLGPCTVAHLDRIDAVGNLSYRHHIGPSIRNDLLALEREGLVALSGTYWRAVAEEPRP